MDKKQPVIIESISDGIRHIFHLPPEIIESAIHKIDGLRKIVTTDYMRDDEKAEPIPPTRYFLVGYHSKDGKGNITFGHFEVEDEKFPSRNELEKAVFEGGQCNEVIILSVCEMSPSDYEQFIS
jgi:hypothetical protein